MSEVGEQGGGGREEVAIEERDGKRNKIMEWKKRSAEQSRRRRMDGLAGGG